MKPHRRSPLREYLAWQWLFRTTAPGKALGASMVVAASLSAASLGILTYHLLCALCALACVASAVAWLTRPRLRVENLFPRKAAAGTEVTGSLRLTNTGKRPAYDVSAGLFALPDSLRRVSAETILSELPPGQADSVSLTLKPLRRGIYPLPRARAYTTFPFGLLRTEAKGEPRAGATHDGALLVYPRFHPVAAINVPISARYQPGGIALSSSVGESLEYIGNREYHPGDSPRQLDHRSWARLAKPVVKEFQEEYYCRVGLVLDTYVPGKRPEGPEGFPEMEAAISLAAAVADALARGEYIIDIFAAGPELYVFRAGRSTAHFENVLEILACVDACRMDPFARIAPALADELDNISSLICVLLDWDASRALLVRAAFEAGCAVKILIVRDGPTSVPLSLPEAAGRVQQLSPQAIRGGGSEAL